MVLILMCFYLYLIAYPAVAKVIFGFAFVKCLRIKLSLINNTMEVLVLLKGLNSFITNVITLVTKISAILIP